jgi:PrtD family type I secretion system ABC transporter
MKEVSTTMTIAFHACPTDEVKSKITLLEALASCRGTFVGIGLFSVVINVLMLTGSLFMLEVYDRVLPSRSVSTLTGLVTLTVLLFFSQGTLDVTRGRLLVRVANNFDYKVAPVVYGLIVRMPLRAQQGGDAQQAVRHLETIRSFIASSGPTVLFDLPWLPFYIAICFAFHVWIGITALAGALLLVALTLLAELLSRQPVRSAANLAAARGKLAETSRRNAEVLVAMGMSDRMRERWLAIGDQHARQIRRANDVSAGLSALGRMFRVMLQSAVLGVGAYLVIQQEATAGIIIAGSILAGRALAPVDLAIANWKGFVAARQSWQRLSQLTTAMPATAAGLALPAPTRSLTVAGLTLAPPGTQKLVVQDVNFSIMAGSALGIIGPSASGKSSLVRCLVGAWRQTRGFVRLDGAALEQWAMSALGQHIGYLPQSVELIEGSIAENIARFNPETQLEAVIAAAKAAGVHELILGLPDGYETQIGEQGMALSAGQQQRIALARALYGNPFLVVLDEPNSNLDGEGEEALTSAIFGVRSRGGIVVVVAHRPSALVAVDHLLVLLRGQQQGFGPKNEILSRFVRQSPSPGPLKLAPQIRGVTP